mgnify:CR=1 FL=1
MEVNFYLVEIKAAVGVQTESGPALKTISGQVKAVPVNTHLFEESSSVAAYLPTKYQKSFENFTIEVPEAFLVPKPLEVSHENCAWGLFCGIRDLTSLHYSLEALEGESILIINSESSTVELAKALGLKVFATKSLQETTEEVLKETGGLGVKNILDFSSSHSASYKQAVMSLLGLRSKWCVCNPNFQLDPPEAFQLFKRNSKVCFSNPEVWVDCNLEFGKFLHLVKLTFEKFGNTISTPSELYSIQQVESSEPSPNVYLMTNKI